MSFDEMFLTGLGVIVLVLVLVVLHKRVPRKVPVTDFTDSWKDLQTHCKDKSTWPQAILEADQLLDKALRRRRYKGKSMGERMVSAQRAISNNDQLWFAHNLAKKVAANSDTRLRETDVKAALFAFRDALRDIGALEKPEATNQEGVSHG